MNRDRAYTTRRTLQAHHDGLEWAAIGQQGAHARLCLRRGLQTRECCAPGGREGLTARWTNTPLFLTPVDPNVALAPWPLVGHATLGQHVVVGCTRVRRVTLNVPGGVCLGSHCLCNHTLLRLRMALLPH